MATPRKDPGAESLADILGGKSAAIDATLGPVAFVAGYEVTNKSIWAASLIALAVSAILAVWRLSRGDKPRAVVIGLLGVAVGVLIVLRTGRIEDVYIPRLVTNLASLLAWIVSILIRWPLLGVVVGTLLGQKGRWRHDPDLLRAYSRGSWVWALQYLVRLVILVPLWAAGWADTLSAAALALTYPLIAVVIAVSWWVIQRTLPPGHPGLRHPRPAGQDPAAQVGADQSDGPDPAAGQTGGQPAKKAQRPRSSSKG